MSRESVLRDIELVLGMRGGQHLCKLQKMPRGKLSSIDDAYVCDIDARLASTVTARYWKGIGANKDNMVIEVISE